MLYKKSVVLIFSVLTLVSSLMNGTVLGADLRFLSGHVPAAVARLSPVGSLAATNQIRLAIGLSLRDPAGLNEFLARLYDPASPDYRKYLTPEEFTTRFGPTERDYEAVKEFAQANGLTVLQTQGNRLVLDVAGPAAAVETALHIRLQTYQHPTEARRFFAPDTEPSVPADLRVADIQGLSDFSKPHSYLKKAMATSAPKDGTGFGGAYMGDDFRNAYAAGTTLTGAGQMVGLLQFDGYYPSDIAAYVADAGGTRANIVVQRVLLDGYDGTPTSAGNPEVSLDIEMAMAMAPGLDKIVVFEAGPNGYPNDVLDAMVQNSAVKNLSSSWGWSGGPDSTTDEIFQEMAAQGQSYFTAAGDSCAFTPGANSVNGLDNPNNENAPTSSPYVTAVGGTTLSMNGSGSSFASETVWNWGGGVGSSGGISSGYAIPGWQAGISMAANKGSTTYRNVPNVALTADNVAVYYGNGGNGYFGGTSCAAPLWAGFMALVNQQAASQGNSPAGLINPAVYAIGKGQNTNYSYAACFHDTTTGNNFSSDSPGNYSAVAGYDLCTGWGTPNGVSLISALSGSNNSSVSTTNSSGGSTNNGTASVAILGISPGTGFTFSGWAGGPFAPTSEIFQLTNGSTSGGNWSLVSTSAWLTVQTTNGTLAGNSTIGVGVTLSPAAKALTMGSYSTSLGFANLSANAIQSIPVTLQVVQPISLSPVQGFTAAGLTGGTFTPASQVFVITNFSGSTMNWSLVNTSSWLSVSAVGGSLKAGGSTVLTVSLSSSARSLKAAVYNANIRFNSTAGLIAVVPFTLAITAPVLQNGGFETGTLAGWTKTANSTVLVIRGNPSFVHSGIYGAQLGPSSSAGYLSQAANTVSGQTYLLSLWLRNYNGRVPNWFQVRWNGAPMFVLTNFANKNWTNLQFLVTAASGTSVLQLAFQGSQDALGLDDVSMTPVANASIKLAARKSDDFQLVWNTSTGVVYQAQYKTNLSQLDWINLGISTPANTATLTTTDTNALQSSPQRFYRLLALPAP